MNQESRMEAIAREVFSQVRTSIVMKMRFLDMAVFRLKPVATELTLGTDGDHLFYHPGWILKRYREEQECVTRDYMHVLLHCIFRHPFVNTLVDHDLWSLACDIAVDAMISEFRQPMMTVKAEAQRAQVIAGLQKDMKQLTAEKLYRRFRDYPPDPAWSKLFRADDHQIWYDRQELQALQLQAQGAGQGQQEQSSGGRGQGDGEQEQQDASTGSNADGSRPQEGEASSASSMAGLREEWKDISEHVQMDLESFAKQQGYRAGNMEQMLAEVNRERYNYEAFLKKFAVMGEVMKINDDEFDYIFYTYGLKLFRNMPLIEPLEYREVKRIRDFVIAIDTSGSTSGELVQRFLTKTYNILESTDSFFSRVNIYIVQCDAKIQETVRITKKEEFDDYLRHMTIKGLGGTDFRPVFAYVDRLIREKAFTNLKGMIYFTDGYGTFPAKKPDYQTAFVFIRDEFNNPDVPPWAIKLILEKDEI